MKKKHIKHLAIVSCLVPQIVLAREYLVCGNEQKIPIELGNIFSIVYLIIRIIVPVMLVITGMTDFFKVTISSNTDETMNKAKQKLINNIIAAVVILMIIPIVKTVLSFISGKNNNYNSCVDCLTNPNICKTVEISTNKLCPGLIGDQDKYDENCNYIADKDDDPSSSNEILGTISTGDYRDWKQCDARWGSLPLGTKGSTICDIGCTTTSMAILMAKSGTVIVPNFNPGVLSKCLAYSSGGAVLYWNDRICFNKIAPSWTFVGTKSLGNSREQIFNTIKSLLEQKYYVMLTVRNGGHYIAVDYIEGNQVYVNDPGNKVTKKLFSSSYGISGIKTAIYYRKEE